MDGDPIVALEIGTSKVCALVGEARSEGHIMVTGIGACPAYGVRKSIVTDMGKAGACIQRAIQGAEQTSAIEIGQVFLVVSGGHILSASGQGSTPLLDAKAGVTREDMEEVKNIARAVNLSHDRETIHSIPRKYTIDDHLSVNNPEGMHGAKLSVDMLVLHGSRNILDNAVQAVQDTGLEVADVAFDGLCAALAVLTPEQKECGVALFDLGAGSTSYVVYADGAIAAAGALAIGGDHITNDIAAGFSLSIKRAELLKRQAGSVLADSSSHYQRLEIPAEVGFPACSVAASDLTAIINARADEIMVMLRDILSGQELNNALGAGIILTGGGAHLKGITTWTSGVFDMPCSIGAPVNFSGMASAQEGAEHAALLGMLRFAVRSSGQRRAERGRLGGLLKKILGQA